MAIHFLEAKSSFWNLLITKSSTEKNTSQALSTILFPSLGHQLPVSSWVPVWLFSAIHTKNLHQHWLVHIMWIRVHVNISAFIFAPISWKKDRIKNNRRLTPFSTCALQNKVKCSFPIFSVVAPLLIYLLLRTGFVLHQGFEVLTLLYLGKLYYLRFNNGLKISPVLISYMHHKYSSINTEKKKSDFYYTTTCGSGKLSSIFISIDSGYKGITNYYVLRQIKSFRPRCSFHDWSLTKGSSYEASLIILLNR